MIIPSQYLRSASLATVMLVATLSISIASTIARAVEITIFSAGAVKPALAELAPLWESRSGHKLNIFYATAGDLRKKLAAGERADGVILPQENFAALEKEVPDKRRMAFILRAIGNMQQEAANA